MMPRSWPEPDTDGDRKLYGYIRQHSWMVRHVLDHKGKKPNFHYSGGIHETLGQPEIVLFGLSKEVGIWIVNEYGKRLRNGDRFVPGERYSGFLEGYDVVFLSVESRRTRRYITWTDWFYDRKGFPLVQLVWPEKKTHLFPWDAACGPDTKRLQPLFDEASHRRRFGWLGRIFCF